MCNQKPDQSSKAFFYSINSQKFADSAGARPGLRLQAEEYPPSHSNGGQPVFQSPCSCRDCCDSAALASLPHSVSSGTGALKRGSCSPWAAAPPGPSCIKLPLTEAQSQTGTWLQVLPRPLCLHWGLESPLITKPGWFHLRSCSQREPRLCC